jgi:NADH dehydrogenase
MGAEMRKTPHILIVGGGYAGFYTAWKLEKKLRRGEARVTVLDPLPYMTYQPFLPEVMAGSIEARHCVVSLRRHLHRTTVVSGSATSIDHADRQVHVERPDGTTTVLDYDIVVVTAGAITRTFPVPGIPEEAYGLRHVEEAVAIRDELLTAFDRASGLPPGPERERLLTVTFVGGGFAGVEGFGELLSLAGSLLRQYPLIGREELRFHLVEATDRILPEVSPKGSAWVVRNLRRRGGLVHLGTTLRSAVAGAVELSTGERFESEILVWTAGIAANPVIARHTDLPVTERGLVVVRPDLRVGTVQEPVEDAWAAGDDAAVPNVVIAGHYTVPNAQHAVRQGKRLASNLVRSLRGRSPRPYRHHNLGSVATLGLGTGIFQAGPIVVKGFPAWLMHRGYHVLAVPTWERKVRVALTWATALGFGRDIVSLASVQHPRAEFTQAGRARSSRAA